MFTSEGLVVLGVKCMFSCSPANSVDDILPRVCGEDKVPVSAIEVMLPVTEWLARMVDKLLDVSEDMVESGRGINSTVSEKPTRVRDGAPTARFSTELVFGGGALALEPTSGWDVDLARDGENVDCSVGSDGVAGRLLPRVSSEGFRILERSWLETAPERR